LIPDESLKVILSTESGRKAFHDFLIEDNAVEVLRLLDAIEALRSLPTENGDTDDAELFSKGKAIVDQFMVSGSEQQPAVSSAVRAEVVDILSEHEVGESPQALGVETSRMNQERDRLMEILTQSQGDIFELLTPGTFTRFIKSEIYSKWQTDRASETLNLRDIALRHSFGGPVREDKTSRSCEPSLRDNAPLLVHESITSGSWLAGLVKATDDLPICICVSSARQDRRGFPIVFVNKMFIETTGYGFDDALDTNCKFLQSSSSMEPDQEEVIRIALREAKPVKVIITNHKKSGEQFKNLLAMKPIFDQHGAYRFVISVQFEARPGNSMRMLNFANAMIEMLPSVAYCTPDE